MKDDVKAIADAKNLKMSQYKKDIDNSLSSIYKEIFNTANKGEHRLEFKISRKDKNLAEDIINNLLIEGFKLITLRDVQNKRDGFYVIFWNK